MRFHQPTTLTEAHALLAEDGAQCLAGGQTMVAMMNAGIIEPTALVSLKKIPDLDRIELRSDRTLVIGSMATHNAVAVFSGISPGQTILTQAASAIAHPAIRNMGTIGGAISHADPAADYPAALVAANATVEVFGPSGTRRIPSDDFFVDYLETALEPGEIVTAVHVPPGDDRAVAVYDKVTRVDGDYAILSLALVAAMNDGVCRAMRIALGSAGQVPVRVPAAEDLLIDTRLQAKEADAAGVALANACDPLDDTRASATYRLRLVPRLLRRALGRLREGDR